MCTVHHRHRSLIFCELSGHHLSSPLFVAERTKPPFLLHSFFLIHISTSSRISSLVHPFLYLCSPSSLSLSPSFPLSPSFATPGLSLLLHFVFSATDCLLALHNLVNAHTTPLHVLRAAKHPTHPLIIYFLLTLYSQTHTHAPIPYLSPHTTGLILGDRQSHDLTSSHHIILTAQDPQGKKNTLLPFTDASKHVFRNETAAAAGTQQATARAIRARPYIRLRSEFTAHQVLSITSRRLCTTGLGRARQAGRSLHGTTEGMLYSHVAFKFNRNQYSHTHTHTSLFIFHPHTLKAGPILIKKIVRKNTSLLHPSFY